jgi:L-lactate dehydrogenase complex protein LldF
LLARAATGQTLSVYTTLITGPRRPGERDGPEALHVVLLDNGRARILASPFRESLQCIRCGACQAACPVKINIPRMLIGLRELQHEAKTSRWESLGYGLWQAVLRRPWLYRLALRGARIILRWRARDGWLSGLPGPGAAWTASRDFPAPASPSFRERWQTLAEEDAGSGKG